MGAAILLALAPRIAQACPMCLSGRDDETRAAFLLTTVFLSVLPLVAVGAVVWWLRRRARQLEELDPQESFVVVTRNPAPAPPTAPLRIRRATDDSSIRSVSA